MKKTLIGIPALVLTFLFLTACAEEQQAGQKAAVDVKSAAATKAAAATAAVKGQPAAAPPAAQPDAAKPPAPTAPAVPGAKPVLNQTAQVQNDPLPPLAVPQGYSYQPRGRRDPFVNPIPKGPVADDDAPRKPVIRPQGLPGVLVSEVKLTGIVYSPVQTMKKAMLVVGRSTYFAQQGDSLFDGVIKEIRPNEVVFSMVSTTTKKPVNRETVVRTGGTPLTLAGENK